MSALKPWAKGPFELILHAEIHLRKGDDYDRRLALISFDNSIEVAISTYLSLSQISKSTENTHDDASLIPSKTSFSGTPREPP